MELNVNDSVKCKIHHDTRINYLTFDTKTFQIYCAVCFSENILPPNKNLEVSDEKKDTDANVWKFCYKHTTDEAMFYCEECSEFICKTCFATDHRNHCASTPDIIVKNIRENVQKTYNDLTTLKKNVEDSILTIQEFNTFFTSQKENFKHALDEINDRILKSLNVKSKEFAAEIETFFNGIDLEVDMSTQRLDNTRKKAAKMLNDFQTFYKEVEEIKSDKRICMYKKEKDAVLNENKKFLSDMQNFLKENLEKIKMKSNKEMENFAKKCSKFQKNAEIYENSVINTIISGIPNICMRVRRFKRYSNSKTKYFKTDSICMLTSNSVNLVGFSLCGLIYEHNSTINSYKVQVKIYELENVQKYDPLSPPLCSIDVDIPSILNIVDPVYQFYLKNAITINKDKVYYIFINNLSSQTFVNTWFGSVTKEKEESINQYSVVCNNSNVKFNFLSAIGVESDFNEFSEGILSDIIFSQID